MKHGIEKFKAVSLALGLALGAVATTQAAPYREYTPLPPGGLQPGVENDFTGTYKYWKDGDTVAKYAATLPAEERWKLNAKENDPPVNEELHGGHIAMDEGEAIYERLNANGQFAKCLGAKNNDLTGLRANHYPHYDAKLGHVVGLEEMIERCAAKQGEKLLNGSHNNSAVSIYIASFSNGMPLNVDLSDPQLKAAFERGKKLFTQRGGWTNFSCATCHVNLAGKRLRGQTPTTPYGDAAHWPTYRVKDEIQSLHVRFTECNRNSGVQPLKVSSKEYTDIEVFLSGLSNGYPVVAPSLRY